MALVCPSDLSGVDLPFVEFIDCSTLSISYDILGVASLSFTVVASSATPVNPATYTDLTFGGVRFTGFITGIEVKRIPGTLAYEHGYTLTATGCRA